jgi:hypothetical protein
MESLKAAAGKVDITPSLTVPVKLLGWGDHTAAGIADPLYARALLLEKHGVRALIVSLDICWASEHAAVVPHGKDQSRTFGPTLPLGTRAAWAQAAGVGESALTVNATHTHTAPALSSDTANSIKKMIAALPSSLREVSLRAGMRDCPLAVYRAVKQTTWANDFLINKTLTVLELVAGKTSVARLVNFGVHPILFKEICQISPDFVGAGMAELDSKRGGVSLYIQGFSGDLGPNVEGFYGGQSKDVKGVRAHGAYLANETRLALENASEIPVDFLKVASSHPSPETILSTKGDKKFEGVNPVRIHGIAFGTKALLLSISAEVFNDYGAMVKNYCCPSYRYVLTSGVANGYSGYLPSAAAFDRVAEVEYEVDASPFVTAAQQQLLFGIRRLVSALRT